MNIVDPIKSRKDVNRIENWLKKHSMRDRLIFAIGVNVGLRVSDILNLNISDVYNKTYVVIREQKTNKYKRFALNNKLQRLLNEYLKDVPISNKPLFSGNNGERIQRSYVYKFLNDAAQAVNIKENIGTHTMRKTFGYHYYKQFNDITLLQKIFNHSSPYVSLAYIGITQEDIDSSYMNFEL